MKSFTITWKNVDGSILKEDHLTYSEYSELYGNTTVPKLSYGFKINKDIFHIKDNFILKAEDTIYKYVEDNSKGTRKQELPTVSKVSTTTKTTKYT